MRWLLVGLLLVACGDRKAREEAALLLKGDATHGAEVFASACERCHGPSDGGECWGGREMVVSATVYGWKLGKMPAQDELSEQDIADVASFLSSACGRRADAGVDGGR